MIVVGVSGAYVAYMVGVHELQATYFERELMQNNVLAMNERHMLLDLKDANAEFRRRVDAANARGLAYLTAASSPQVPLNADLFSLQAQEEFAASRALQPFVAATRSSWEAPRTSAPSSEASRATSPKAAGSRTNRPIFRTCGTGSKRGSRKATKGYASSRLPLFFSSLHWSCSRSRV